MHTGAVKPACHSIENAKSLPPSIFECSPLSAPGDDDEKSMKFEDNETSSLDKLNNFLDDISEIGSNLLNGKGCPKGQFLCKSTDPMLV